MKTTLAALALAAAAAGAQAGVTVTKPDIMMKVVEKAIPEKVFPDLPKKVNASVTFKTITIPKVVPDFEQIEKDFINKVDIVKPEVKLPKELPEPHMEKKLNEVLAALNVASVKALADAKPDKFYNLDPEITKVYAKIKTYQDAKYTNQGKKVDDAIIASVKNTKTVVIDTKHPNKTALVAQLEAAVDGLKANLQTPVLDKTDKPTPPV